MRWNSRLPVRGPKPSIRFALLLALSPPTFCPGAEGDFATVREQFGFLQTVAGTGAKDDGNDWKPANEGRPATEADLSRPHITVADPAGNLYIADKEAHAIRLVKLDGTIHTIAGTGVDGFDGDGPAKEHRLSNPNGLFRLKNGNLYILDLTNFRIRRIDSRGMLSTVVHDQSLSIGRGLWVSESEDLIYYASGSEVRRWREGEGVDTYADGFVALGNIAMDPEGRLVVTDRGAHVAIRIESNGKKTIIAGNGTASGGGSGRAAVDTGLEELRGIAFRSEGGFFVCTHRGSQIWYVDPQGIIHLFIDGDRDDDTHSGDGAPITAPGPKISEPRAVTLSPTGDLIITENDRGYVRLLERKDKKIHFLEPLAPRASVPLRFRSVAGIVYDIEHSHDLRRWDGVGRVAATARISSHQPEQSGPAGYFRIGSPNLAGDE